MKHQIKKTIFIMTFLLIYLFSSTLNVFAGTKTITPCAKIKDQNITLKGSVLTTCDSETMSYSRHDEYNILNCCYHGDYGAVSQLAHFFDHKGLYTVVCKKSNYLYFDRYSTKLKKSSTIKIKMKYPMFGDAVIDKSGNYYIIWGKEDTSGKGGIVTMAVSKYTYSGKHVKTTGYKTSTDRYSWDTRIPFDAGNCDTIIDKNGLLVCTYAREMYNGHQSNDVLCVDTKTMKKKNEYFNYASHSFDQRIINLSDGGVCMVNKGDTYPRAFAVDFYNTTKKSGEYFHFYGYAGNNYINAWLGGVVECGKNVYLVASSAKSMSKNSLDASQNVFVQLLDPNAKLKNSTSRKGTCDGISVTDKNIKWITNYSSNYTAVNPQVVAAGKDRFVVMWEQLKTGKFVQSYYCVLNSKGEITQKTTALDGVRLTSHEDPVYRSGYIYWTTAGKIGTASVKTSSSSYMSGYKVVDGTKGVIHRIKVGENQEILKTPVLSSVSNTKKGIVFKWKPVKGAKYYRVYIKKGNGTWKKYKDTTSTQITHSTAAKGTKYTYTVRCLSKNATTPISYYNTKGKTIKCTK